MGLGDIRKKKEVEVDVPIKKKQAKGYVPFVSGPAISNLDEKEIEEDVEDEIEEDDEEDEETEEPVSLPNNDLVIGIVAIAIVYFALRFFGII